MNICIFRTRLLSLHFNSQPVRYLLPTLSHNHLAQSFLHTHSRVLFALLFDFGSSELSRRSFAIASHSTGTTYSSTSHAQYGGCSAFHF